MQTYTAEKYSALQSIIDFFSQNLHLDQIVEYGFNIFNALEEPIHAAIYVLDDAKTHYRSAFEFGDNDYPQAIEKETHHDTFAVRNGFFLRDPETQKRYFCGEMLDCAGVESVMPLIIDDLLYGFVFTRHQVQETKMGDGFLSRFNFLMNLALEKASRYIERKALREAVDEQLFNLNTLSHTVRLLLSELSQEALLELALGVIKEMSASSVAAIGLLDASDGLVKVEAYASVHSEDKCYEVFRLKCTTPPEGCLVLDIESDQALLGDLFYHPEKFSRLGATHVFLLVNKTIKGFVTLGPSYAKTSYSKELLSRIRDVSDILTVGIENAQQYETIFRQKDQLDKNVKVMKRMNHLMKGINASESLEELTDQIMDTLNLTFGIDEAYLALHMPDFRVVARLSDAAPKTDALIETLVEHNTGELEVQYTETSIQAYCGELYDKTFDACNCLLIAPILIAQYDSKPLGYLVVMKSKKRLHEKQTIMIEMLVQSVAPIIQHMLTLQQVKASYVLSPLAALKAMHQRCAADSQRFDIPFYVYVKRLSHAPLAAPDLKAYEHLQTQCLNGSLVIFAYDLLDEALYDVALPYASPTWERLETFLKACYA